MPRSGDTTFDDKGVVATASPPCVAATQLGSCFIRTRGLHPACACVAPTGLREGQRPRCLMRRVRTRALPAGARGRARRLGRGNVLVARNESYPHEYSCTHRGQGGFPHFSWKNRLFSLNQFNHLGRSPLNYLGRSPLNHSGRISLNHLGRSPLNLKAALPPI